MALDIETRQIMLNYLASTSNLELRELGDIPVNGKDDAITKSALKKISEYDNLNERNQNYTEALDRALTARFAQTYNANHSEAPLPIDGTTSERTNETIRQLKEQHVQDAHIISAVQQLDPKYHTNLDNGLVLMTVKQAYNDHHTEKYDENNKPIYEKGFVPLKINDDIHDERFQEALGIKSSTHAKENKTAPEVEGHSVDLHTKGLLAAANHALAGTSAYQEDYGHLDKLTKQQQEDLVKSFQHSKGLPENGNIHDKQTEQGLNEINLAYDKERHTNHDVVADLHNKDKDGQKHPDTSHHAPVPDEHLREKQKELLAEGYDLGKFGADGIKGGHESFTSKALEAEKHDMARLGAHNHEELMAKLTEEKRHAGELATNAPPHGGQEFVKDISSLTNTVDINNLGSTLNNLGIKHIDTSLIPASAADGLSTGMHNALANLPAFKLPDELNASTTKSHDAPGNSGSLNFTFLHPDTHGKDVHMSEVNSASALNAAFAAKVTQL